MTEDAVKVLNALKVQGIEDTPAIKKRVAELLTLYGFDETMIAVFDNQDLFTPGASSAPAPSPSPEWTDTPALQYAPAFPEVPLPPENRTDTRTNARTGGEADQQPAPISAAEIQADIAAYGELSDAEKDSIRQKLQTDKALARLTGQKLFGRGQESGSFICTKCGSGNPGVVCRDWMRTTRFQCRSCNQGGSLVQFEALRNGRQTATADDFLTVEAVAYDADTMQRA